MGMRTSLIFYFLRRPSAAGRAESAFGFALSRRDGSGGCQV